MQFEKGKTIYFQDNDGNDLTKFCLGCEWGDVVRHEPYKAIVKEGFLGFGRQTEWREREEVVEVDIDLSCVMFDEHGKAVDHIYSPLYQLGETNTGMPNGKMESSDGAIRHAVNLADDLNLEEICNAEGMQFDLDKVSPFVHQIVFFMNVCNDEEFQGDFSDIPYIKLRMFAGTPEDPGEIYDEREIPTKCEAFARMRAIVLAKLYRDETGRWAMTVFADAFDDPNIVVTLQRLLAEYNK